MAQQRILKLTKMPQGHVSLNGGYLDEAEIAVHNLEAVTGKSATAEELKAEETRLLAEYYAEEYIQLRTDAYPNAGKQLEKIYDDGIDKWKTEMVDPVKAKFPKGSPGAP